MKLHILMIRTGAAVQSIHWKAGSYVSTNDLSDWSSSDDVAHLKLNELLQAALLLGMGVEVNTRTADEQAAEEQWLRDYRAKEAVAAE